jgi:hypothetical protein
MMRSFLRRDFSCPREIDVVRVALKKSCPSLRAMIALRSAPRRKGIISIWKLSSETLARIEKMLFEWWREIIGETLLAGLRGLEGAPRRSARRLAS